MLGKIYLTLTYIRNFEQRNAEIFFEFQSLESDSIKQKLLFYRSRISIGKRLEDFHDNKKATELKRMRVFQSSIFYFVSSNLNQLSIDTQGFPKL